MGAFLEEIYSGKKAGCLNKPLKTWEAKSGESVLGRD